jgi:hypothetical protein
MKITNVTNDNIVIQARNEKDFILAQAVAQKMADDNDWMVQCCVDEQCMWLQLTACWNHLQAEEFTYAYQAAKLSLKGI